MMRRTRYQALVIKDHHVLLIKHLEHATGRAYWVLPGGGREADETEQECVVREAREETNLQVVVDYLLFDEPGLPGDAYPRLKTYVCRPVGGEASPGHEPEIEASEKYAISEVRWFDLSDERGWGSDLIQDPFTYPQLLRARKALGYRD